MIPLAIDSLGIPFALLILGLVLWGGLLWFLFTGRPSKRTPERETPPESTIWDYVAERREAEARARAAAMRSRERREAAYRTRDAG